MRAPGEHLEATKRRRRPRKREANACGQTRGRPGSQVEIACSLQMLLDQCLAVSFCGELGANWPPGDSEAQRRAVQLFGQLQEAAGGCSSADLAASLGRLRFAGFLMPSWLLVSGARQDLRLVQTSWARGQLRELNLETIGK